MEVTNIDNQQDIRRKKLKIFFKKMIDNRKKSGFCFTRDIMSDLTDKWTLLIVYNLAYFETMRFKELNQNIRDISSRMLSVSLKKLEAYDIVQRKAYAEVPPRVEYSLTDFGLELSDQMMVLNEWFVDQYISGSYEYPKMK